MSGRRIPETTKDRIKELLDPFIGTKMKTGYMRGIAEEVGVCTDTVKRMADNIGVIPFSQRDVYIDPEVAFWLRVEPRDGHLIWTGRNVFYFRDETGRRKNRLPRSFIYERYIGDLTTGFWAMPFCGVDECVDPMHLAPSVSPREPLTLEEKFWRNVAVGDEPEHVPGLGNCWVWTGGKLTKRYGGIEWRGRTHYAHRMAWKIAEGEPPPDGTLVCHHCDNETCVRRSHLFLGTPKDNVVDMLRKGRAHHQMKAAA